MPDSVLPYKGFDVAIDYKDADHADLKIADRTFALTRHEGPLQPWMCDEAYFGSPDIEDVARHLVDYWYIYSDDENRPPPIGHDAHGGADKPAKPKRGGGRKPRGTGGHGHGG
jgi:hypothetical protein